MVCVWLREGSQSPGWALGGRCTLCMPQVKSPRPSPGPSWSGLWASSTGPLLHDAGTKSRCHLSSWGLASRDISNKLHLLSTTICKIIW